MSTYTLFGQEISFTVEQENFAYLLYKSRKDVEVAQSMFVDFYSGCNGIYDVLEQYPDYVEGIGEKVAENLFDTLKDMDIYDISKSMFLEKCAYSDAAEEDYNEIVDEYNEIIENLNLEIEYRAERKASRTTLVGGGFGLSGAMKGMMKAGAFNAVTGLGHSIVNSIGNARSESKAEDAQRALYNSNDTVQTLLNGLRLYIYDVYDKYINLVNDYKCEEEGEVYIDGDCFEPEKSNALVENSESVDDEEKRRELFARAVQFCPYNSELLEMLFAEYEEEREVIFEIAEDFCCDLSDIYETAIKKMYPENEENSDEELLHTKENIKNFMEKYDVEESETFDAVERECMIRFCAPYEKSVPGENAEVLQMIRDYVAKKENKAQVISSMKIWELADEYGVKFSEAEKDIILSRVIYRCENVLGFDEKATLEKIEFIKKELGITVSKAIEEWEHVTLSKIASKYNSIPVGEADEIIKGIIGSLVSDNGKASFVVDKDIWELFTTYPCERTKDEKYEAISRVYERIKNEEGISDSGILEKLDFVIKKAGIADDVKALPSVDRECLFELLTGIRAKQQSLSETGKKRAEEIAYRAVKGCATRLEKCNPSGEVPAMIYDLDRVRKEATRLKYCTLSEDENPLIIYHEQPVDNRGIYGFCLTDKRLISAQSSGDYFEKDLHQIDLFYKKGILGFKISVVCGGDMRTLSVSELERTELFLECMNEILGSVKSNHKEKEKNADLHQKAEKLLYVDLARKNSPLIEYFDMLEKCEEVYAQSGKAEERARILKELTDENIEKFDYDQLEEYLKAVGSLWISEEQRELLSEKLNVNMALIRSGKDQNTISILEDCKDENFSNLSLDRLQEIQRRVEKHRFLAADTKKELLRKLVDGIRKATYRAKLDATGENYDELMSLLNAFDKENLTQEEKVVFKEELENRILESQKKALDNIIEGIANMSHAQVRAARTNVLHYTYDKELSKEKLILLTKRNDEIENSVLSDFCAKLPSVNLDDMEGFKKRISEEGFKEEIISKYPEIDERYKELLAKKRAFDYQKRIDKTNGDYDALLGLLSHLDDERLSEEEKDEFRTQLRSKVAESQVKALDGIMKDLDNMSHTQIRNAMISVAHYQYNKELSAEKKAVLAGRLDYVENKILSDFCENISTATVEDIDAFKARIEREGFKEENISKYTSIDERYGELVFDKNCADCKAKALLQIAEDKVALQNLLYSFKKCGKAEETIAPYLNRLCGLLDAGTAYEEKREAAYVGELSALNDFVNKKIVTDIQPLTDTHASTEIYACGEDMEKYSAYDIYKCKFTEGEIPILYLLRVKVTGFAPKMCITNRTMYLSKNYPDGKTVSIPLENISGFKANRIMNGITVNASTGNGEIYSELSYKHKDNLAGIISEIVSKVKPLEAQIERNEKALYQEYRNAIKVCIEQNQIPCDDIAEIAPEAWQKSVIPPRNYVKAQQHQEKIENFGNSPEPAAPVKIAEAEAPQEKQEYSNADIPEDIRKKLDPMIEGYLAKDQKAEAIKMVTFVMRWDQDRAKAYVENLENNPSL